MQISILLNLSKGSDMKLLQISFLLLSFLILLGCDSTTNNTNSNNNSISIEGTEISNNSGTLASNSDIDVVEISAKAGYSYLLDLDQDSWAYYETDLKIVTPNGDTILNEKSFKADSAGTYKILVFLSLIGDGYTGDFDYTLKVTEHEPFVDELSGKWILIEEKYTYRSYSDSYAYSANSADRVIEFKNDSIFTYVYDSYEEDSIYLYSYLAIESWLWEFNVSLNDNRLTFSWANDYISGTFVYERFEGSISGITWEEENDNIDISSLVGAWYLSYEKEMEEGYEDGEVEEYNEENSYSSGASSRKIIVISSDYIKYYYNNGYGSFDSSTESINQNLHFLKDLTKENGKLVRFEVECEAYEDEWYGGVYKEEYSPYSGEFPPEEWTQINLPASFTSLSVDETSSGNLTAGDTIWFRIPVTSGEAYTIEVTEAQFDTYLSMISGEKEFVADDDDGGFDLLSMISFNSTYNGYYYVALRGYSQSDFGTYSVSFSEGYKERGNRTINKLKDKEGIKDIKKM